MQQKPYKSIRIFENPYLEKLSHVHPITPLFLWAPIVGWFIYRSFAVHDLSTLSFSVVGLCGFFFWTLTEYVLHRFLFHFNTEGPLQERLQYLMHGLHHDDPIDPTRLVMPPFPAIVLGVTLYSVFRISLGPVWVDPFFAFFVTGYLCYDYIHFAVHHFTPRTRVGKMIKHHHMLHHYATPNARWGVSSPIWDYVFGTLKSAEKKEQVV